MGSRAPNVRNAVEDGPGTTAQLLGILGRLEMAEAPGRYEGGDATSENAELKSGGAT